MYKEPLWQLWGEQTAWGGPVLQARDSLAWGVAVGRGRARELRVRFGSEVHRLLGWMGKEDGKG